MTKVRTSCPSAVEGVYDRRIVSQTENWTDHCSALLVKVVGGHLTSDQREGRRARGGIDLTVGWVLVTTYRKTTT